MSRINLSDDRDTIANKVRKAKTDPEPLPSDEGGLEGRPEAQNLVGIYAALAGTTSEAVLKDHGGAQFSQFKPALAELAVEKIGPIQEEMLRLTADPGQIDAVLRDGAERAQAIAEPIMNEVKDIVGLLRT